MDQTADGRCGTNLARSRADESDPALDLVEPISLECSEPEARMAHEPGLDPGMLVGGQVVGDQMNRDHGWLLLKVS